MRREHIINKIICGNASEVLRQFPSEFIDCIVTSPPYYWLRDYGTSGQIGLEPSPEEYVEHLMDVFGELRRVLKPSGTFWLNIGDSYAGSKPMRSIPSSAKSTRLNRIKENLLVPKIKIPSKSMICIPERVMFALLEDGWILRNKLIWVKVPPMPSSVKDRFKCTYEFIYLLVRNKTYYFNLDAVKVPYAQHTIERIKRFISNNEHFDPNKHKHGNLGQAPFQVCENSVKSALAKTMQIDKLCPHGGKNYKDGGINSPEGRLKQLTKHIKKDKDESGKVDGWIRYEKLISGYFPKNSNGDRSRARLDKFYLLEKLDLTTLKKNPGDVWFLPTANFKGAHFAVFPQQLPELCIKAGCPEKGLVLDPFCGSGTTLIVAKKLGRNYIGIDLNPEYVKMSQKRISNVEVI